MPTLQIDDRQFGEAIHSVRLQAHEFLHADDSANPHPPCFALSFALSFTQCFSLISNGLYDPQCPSELGTTAAKKLIFLWPSPRVNLLCRQGMLHGGASLEQP